MSHTEMFFDAKKIFSSWSQNIFFLPQEFFFLDTRTLHFFSVKQNFFLQGKILGQEKNNCFVTILGKHFIGNRNYFCGMFVEAPILNWFEAREFKTFVYLLTS